MLWIPSSVQVRGFLEQPSNVQVREVLWTHLERADSLGAWTLIERAGPRGALDAPPDLWGRWCAGGGYLFVGIWRRAGCMGHICGVSELIVGLWGGLKERVSGLKK